MNLREALEANRITKMDIMKSLIILNDTCNVCTTGECGPDCPLKDDEGYCITQGITYDAIEAVEKRLDKLFNEEEKHE